MAFAYFFWRADYPWQLSLLAGLSIGALVYVIRRTVDQMIGLFSPRDLSSPRDLLSPRDSEEVAAESVEESPLDGTLRQGKSSRAANNNR